MFAMGSRYLVRTTAFAVAAAFMVAALVTTPVRAATVAEFLANPSQVMTQYPNGGADLISLIRDAAVANPGALATIAALLSTGSADQQAAVGSGLGQAYNLVLTTDQAYAAQIAAAVANSNSEFAKTAYAGVTLNVATASTGGGAGGAGGSGTGGSGGGTGSGGAPSGGTFSGPSGTTGQAPTPNSGGPFTGGGGGASGAGSSGGGGAAAVSGT